MRPTQGIPLRSVLCLVFGGMLLGLPAYGQTQTDPGEVPGTVNLSAKIDALTRTVEQMQNQLQQSRLEIQQLREMIAQMARTQFNATAGNAAHEQGAPVLAQQQNSEPVPARIAEDDWQILNARVEEHEQVKVESSSKYRLKLSGIVLFNAFDTSGQLDNFDVATTAVPRLPYEYTGSLGASFRQSLLGLRGIGPTVAGATTTADLQMDFLNSAGSPYGGIGAGLVGLRTARVQFDWSKFSLTAGLETPFFSPNSPTSYVSLAVPAFASAGNLWNWTPGIRAERRFDFTSSEIKLQAGLLDSTGYSLTNSNMRVPTPGEGTRQPVYAVRLSGNNRTEDHSISFGISGVFSPLQFANGQELSASGAIADWTFPLTTKFQLTGAFFSGKGLDAFGGVALPAVQPQDYGHYLYTSAPMLAAIPVIGGWSQLKFTLNNRSEFNAAAGLGARDSARLRTSAAFDPFLLTVPSSNRVYLFNYIFRPRGDLVLSAEYRRFHTADVVGSSNIAAQVGLAAGFLF
jgi:hypothetical protein